MKLFPLLVLASVLCAFQADADVHAGPLRRPAASCANGSCAVPQVSVQAPVATPVTAPVQTQAACAQAGEKTAKQGPVRRVFGRIFGGCR